jgi:autotransporter strand-loop-strand O-heptosyltransferase
MAHKEQTQFCQKVKEKFPNYFIDKKVLDVGSLDINGSNKNLFENCTYIGIDVGEGNNVDVIAIGHLYDAPDEYFDTIISTEVFEHDMYYEKTIENIIRMLKPGGLFLFTCAAPGRPEHGTKRKGEWNAPLLSQISEEWSNYYKNLTEKDIRKTSSFNIWFPDGHFEINNQAEIPSDLYFYGIKSGSKYLTDNIIPEYSKTEFADDIFVIDSWPDNEAKENDLLNCIKRLKVYNIPILLSGHYPIKPEIQKMVDYYLYDKNNPLLMKEQFKSYMVNSVRWSDMEDVRVENTHEFHHDYAIWETMRNSFNFCKYLGKKYIHFMEYDNLPDVFQYQQAFIENIRRFDAVLYEYHKKSSSHPDPYIGTFIFSIRTDVAVKVIDLIKTKETFFINAPKGWQLEKNFLYCLKKITPRIYVCPYISNNNELNMHAVWNRDGMQRNGVNIQFYLAVDDNDNLYLHTISGNYKNEATEDYLIEATYQNHKKFYNITKGSFLVFDLGKYKKGHTVKCYHQGIEIFNEFLGKEIIKYKEFNKLTKKIKQMDNPPKININFIDGPFAEIINDVEKTYRVQFIDANINKVKYETDLKSNQWAKPSLKYHVKWIIKINGIDNDFHYEHHFDPADKRILIGFESNSLGDTLAWIPYVEKFRIDKKCKVVCSTFHNNLFVNQYTDIEFVEPGTTVNNLYGLYRIGVFLNLDKWDTTKHLTDPKTLPLTKIASEILGLDYIELKPKLPVLTTEKKKLVSIGFHATAQAKYWNNPNGWQEVVDFLIEKGYEVRMLSKEETGYMGNWYPKGVTKKNTPTVESALKVIQESELFIGVSSGLSWLAWGSGVETILISGFTNDDIEPKNGIRRIINKDVCHGCWSHYIFDKGDWNWCPLQKGTDRQFECTRTITSEQVISEIKSVFGW